MSCDEIFKLKTYTFYVIKNKLKKFFIEQIIQSFTNHTKLRRKL
jgi:hypothetical protein